MLMSRLLYTRLKATFAVAFAFAVLVGVTACSEEALPTPTPVPTVEPPTAEFGMTAETVMAPMRVSFSVDEPVDGGIYFWDFGDASSGTGPNVVHEYLDAGSFTVKLNANRGSHSILSEDSVSVQPGAAGWVVLNANSLILESGETHQFELEAFDDLGNAVTDPQIEWIADPATGAISPEGLFSAGDEVGFSAQGVKAAFHRAGVTVEELVPVDVVFGPLSQVEISPETIDTRVSWSIDLDAMAKDSAGHLIEDAEITWEILRPGDEIDQTGQYTPSASISDEGASLLVVHASYEGAEIEQIVYGTVAPGILDRIEASPELLDLESGAEVQLSAKAFDRFDNELELDDVEWNLTDPDAGHMTEDGFFAAGSRAGEFDEPTLSVRGFKDGVQVFGYVPLSIAPTAASSIEFKFPSDSVPAGAASPIELRVLDVHGNDITDVDVYLEILEGGSLQSGNVFKAGLTEGDFEGAVIARILPDGGGNAELIEVTTDLSVRQRSSDFLAVDIVGPAGPEIYLINLATAELVPISAKLDGEEFSKTTPAWWPDGSRLMFGLDLGMGYQLFDIDPFRDDIRQLTDLGGGIIMPAVSPDGSRVAFLRATDWAWQLFTATFPRGDEGEINRLITEDDVTKISSNDEVRHLLPYWSPDGNWLLYTAISQQGEATAYMADPNDPSSASGLEVRGGAGLGWHPDGETILLSADRGSSGSTPGNVLVKMNVFTGEWSELEIGDVGALVGAYSPDGSEIAFVDEEEGALWLTDADGSGLRQALSPQYRATITAWRPKPLELPTPTDAHLGNTPLRVPNGAVESIRIESEEFGTVGPYTAVLVTDVGEIHIDLYNHLAPITVENFINLIEAGYYDGLTFHTVEEGSAVFTGSIVNMFGGTAGYYIPSEYAPEAVHDSAGIVSMLSVGEDSGSSQFLITLAPHPEWDAYESGAMRDCGTADAVCYSVFGKVTKGLELLEQFGRLTEGTPPHRIIEARVVKQLESQ